jgi:hypothetical protein
MLAQKATYANDHIRKHLGFRIRPELCNKDAPFLRRIRHGNTSSPVMNGNAEKQAE